MTNKKRCCNIKMYVEKVNTKSPSLNSQLNDRLTRKGTDLPLTNFWCPNRLSMPFGYMFVKSMPFCVETIWYWLGILFLLHLPLFLCIGSRLCADIRVNSNAKHSLYSFPTTEYITQAKIQRYHNSFATTPYSNGRASQQTSYSCCYLDYLVRLTNLFNTMWWNHRRVPDSTQHQDKITRVIEDNLG